MELKFNFDVYHICKYIYKKNSTLITKYILIVQIHSKVYRFAVIYFQVKSENKCDVNMNIFWVEIHKYNFTPENTHIMKFIIHIFSGSFSNNFRLTLSLKHRFNSIFQKISFTSQSNQICQTIAYILSNKWNFLLKFQTHTHKKNCVVFLIDFSIEFKK